MWTYLHARDLALCQKGPLALMPANTQHLEKRSDIWKNNLISWSPCMILLVLHSKGMRLVKLLFSVLGKHEYIEACVPLYTCAYEAPVKLHANF